MTQNLTESYCIASAEFTQFFIIINAIFIDL